VKNGEKIISQNVGKNHGIYIMLIYSEFDLKE